MSCEALFIFTSRISDVVVITETILQHTTYNTIAAPHQSAAIVL